MLATTTVGPGGVWAVTSTISLPIDPHTVKATQLASTGAKSEVFITFSIIHNIVVLSPTFDQPVDGHEPAFTGTGQPGATIEVRGRSGRLLAATVVGGDKRWTSTSTVSIPNGVYTVDVFQVVDGLMVKAEATFTIVA